MKISVIMIDGGFRENIYAAQYFSEQDFSPEEYEIIWVEYFDQPHKDLSNLSKVKVITLNKNDTYHSSYCFNKGIEEAKGEIIIIPDADQIVKPDFLTKVFEIHQRCDDLVAYIYRYDEIRRGALENHSFEELDKKCILKNPTNYGGCLTVAKKWLLEINGYEMHPLFESGFHANGMDIYTRFKNLGLAIKWFKGLKLYHPWHDSTLIAAPQYPLQHKLIEWRKRNLQYLAINGIDVNKNVQEADVIALADKIYQEREPHENEQQSDEITQKIQVLEKYNKLYNQLFNSVLKITTYSVFKNPLKKYKSYKSMIKQFHFLEKILK